MFTVKLGSLDVFLFVLNTDSDWPVKFFLSSVISTILSTLQIEGFDVKALRAFRVLRPLRLVSGVPSKLSRLLNGNSIALETK